MFGRSRESLVRWTQCHCFCIARFVLGKWIAAVVRNKNVGPACVILPRMEQAILRLNSDFRIAVAVPVVWSQMMY